MLSSEWAKGITKSVLSPAATGSKHQLGTCEMISKARKLTWASNIQWHSTKRVQLVHITVPPVSVRSLDVHYYSKRRIGKESRGALMLILAVMYAPLLKFTSVNKNHTGLSSH